MLEKLHSINILFQTLKVIIKETWVNHLYVSIHIIKIYLYQGSISPFNQIKNLVNTRKIIKFK